MCPQFFFHFQFKIRELKTSSAQLHSATSTVSFFSKLNFCRSHKIWKNLKILEMLFSNEFPKNSNRIPKEFPKNSPKSPNQNPQSISKEFPTNSQKIQFVLVTVCQKVPILDLSKWIFNVKNHPNLFFFFFF